MELRHVRYAIFWRAPNGNPLEPYPWHNIVRRMEYQRLEKLMAARQARLQPTFWAMAAIRHTLLEPLEPIHEDRRRA